MKRYLRLIFSIILLTIIFTGLIGLRTMLPLTKEIVVEAETSQSSNIDPEPADEDVDHDSEVVVVDTEKPPVQEEPKAPIVVDENQKVAYLTFDDGPSPRVTPRILDTLKEYNIQATFFVIGNLAEAQPELLRRIQEEGHLICNHTYTHDYKKVYADPQSFLDELRQADETLSSILVDGYQSNIIRFPGGSFGESRKPFREAATAAGYNIIDWNVVNGDAEAQKVSPQRLLQRVKETLQNKKQAVILMHDANAKKTTADALPAIIEYLQDQGYVFKTLSHYNF
ncbi:polysaccharide deacetylase family protein [Alkaliphilus crotonatoxidans]